jgi:hypothetical protein
MTEPSRRATTSRCATDEGELATRSAFVRFRAGSEPAQRRMLGRVEHVSSGRATTFSPSTSRWPSSDACSPRSISGGRTDPGLQRHADLQAWIPAHPDADLSVDALDRLVAISPRKRLPCVRARGRHGVSSNARPGGGGPAPARREFTGVGSRPPRRLEGVRAMTIEKGAPGDLRTDVRATDWVASSTWPRAVVAHVHTSEELLAFPSRGWRELTAPSRRRRKASGGALQPLT